mgnify:CR=1 FL=1
MEINYNHEKNFIWFLAESDNSKTFLFFSQWKKYFFHSEKNTIFFTVKKTPFFFIVKKVLELSDSSRNWIKFWVLVQKFQPQKVYKIKSLSQGNFLPIRKEHFGVSQNPFCHQLPLTKDGQRHHFGASILLGCCVMRHSQNSHKNQAKLATHRKSAVCQIGPNFENVK